MGGLSPSPFCVVMKVTARSRPAKGWPCLMKTDEAEIKCLPTLRDSFITVSPRAIEHLGLELSFNRPCLTAPWWHNCSLPGTWAPPSLPLFISFFSSFYHCFNRQYHCLHLCVSLPPGLYKLRWSFNLKSVSKFLGFGSPCRTSIAAPSMLTHMGSTAIRSRNLFCWRAMVLI